MRRRKSKIIISIFLIGLFLNTTGCGNISNNVEPTQTPTEEMSLPETTKVDSESEAEEEKTTEESALVEYSAELNSWNISFMSSPNISILEKSDEDRLHESSLYGNEELYPNQQIAIRALNHILTKNDPTTAEDFSKYASMNGFKVLEASDVEISGFKGFTFKECKEHPSGNRTIVGYCFFDDDMNELEINSENLIGEDAVLPFEIVTLEKQTKETAYNADDLDDYVGYYTSVYVNGNDEAACAIDFGKASLEDNDDIYAMEGYVDRIIVFGAYKISSSDEGVVFNVRDTNDQSGKMTFYKNDGENSYTLRIDESPDPRYLPTGTVIEGYKKTEAPKGESSLPDGQYYTCLYPEPTEYAQSYILSTSFFGDTILLNGVLEYKNDNTTSEFTDEGTYIIETNANTRYIELGECDILLNREEYIAQFNNLINSGVNMGIRIENGYATEITFFS